MAKKLNLRVKWTGEAVRVSWNDVKANDQNIAAAIILPIAMLAFFILSAITAFNGGGFGFMGLVIVGSLVGAIWFRGGTSTQENFVDFTDNEVIHKKKGFPISEVTRFEYGVKSALTGITPAKDGNGNHMSDPMLIRMWINDASAYEISSNNWEIVANHEIRDMLEKTLIAVRDQQKQQEHEEEFGKVDNDTGMPDY